MSGAPGHLGLTDYVVVWVGLAASEHGLRMSVGGLYVAFRREEGGGMGGEGELRTHDCGIAAKGTVPGKQRRHRLGGDEDGPGVAGCLLDLALAGADATSAACLVSPATPSLFISSTMAKGPYAIVVHLIILRADFFIQFRGIFVFSRSLRRARRASVMAHAPMVSRMGTIS